MIKTRIIVSSTIKESEKLKSLAYFGERTLGTRYMSTLELARYLLQLSGVVVPYKFIQNDDLGAALYHKTREIEYFKNFTYRDILALIDSVNDLRRYIVDDEPNSVFDNLPDDIFVEKNEAVKDFYSLLTSYLSSNGCIDEVGTIRYAYEHIVSINNIDFEIYEGDKIESYNLDMALLNKASNNNVNKISFDNLVHISSYTKAFSQVNEIENVLSYIYKNSIPFDQCLIAAADTADYSNILINYRDLLHIPTTIGVGKTVLETGPGQLYSTFTDYKKSHYHGDYLKKLIYHESFNVELLMSDLGITDEKLFDDVLTTCGDLKLSFEDMVKNNEKMNSYINLIDKRLSNGLYKVETIKRNDQLEYVKALSKIFNDGIYDLFERYTIVNDDIDNNAYGKILKCLFYMEEVGIEYDDMAQTIFQQKVGRKSIEPGKLYFTSINNAASLLRKHLFIVGLSSNAYPGKSGEDPIILDRDYLPFGVRDASNREIINNRNAYLSLIREACKYDVDIHLSYAYYNSITLKEQNASSMVFLTYKLEYGEDKTIKDLEKDFENNTEGKFSKVEYFSTDLLPISQIGQALVNNKKIKTDEVEIEEESEIEGIPVKQEIVDIPLSASMVEKYVECPYQFFLSKILEIPQPEDPDIFEVIPPNRYGTLAHSLLERLDKKNTNEKEFLKRCEEEFDDYFLIHYSDNDGGKAKNKEEFLDMMKIAYNLEELDPPYIKEKDIEYKEPISGLTIHGFPDKVIKLSTGELYAVDYKTGRKITHRLGDPSTLIQCIIYCYILEKKKGIPVNGFEFRYLRLDKKVSSVDGSLSMNEYYSKLEDILKEIRQSYDTGVFPINSKHCDGCYYKAVCTRKKK